MKYEQVIGLEVHCELKTKSKMFSSSPVSFAKTPNTMVNEIDFSMPGIMPSVNKKAVEYALRVCHALHMEIDDLICFDRKNYYYSDLPKGFQITQQQRPIGKNGYLDIIVDNQKKRIEIERLHMEEDTAKQTHFDDYTLIDYNRAGIPLIEIVTKPVLRNGKEAAIYLEKLRQIFLYTEVSDAKLEEGSMRCDINLSLRPIGSKQLGVRTEIKNLNSISNVQKAIEYEASRQEKILLSKKEVIQETRRYDEGLRKTVLMRSKGNSVDYKYYSEPNILPIRLSQKWIKSIKNHLNMMPDVREDLYIHKYHLSSIDAKKIVSSKELSDFFNETVLLSQHYQIICNWLLGDVLAYLNKHHLKLNQTLLTPSYLSTLINLIEEEVISSKQAKQVFEIMMKEGKDPRIIIEEKNMKQISNKEELTFIINQILDKNTESLIDYFHGKDRVIGYLVGQIMKETRGQANPKSTNELLIQLLEERKG